MKKIKLVNLYISKIFLIKFLQIIFGFSLLIFLTNLIEIVDKASEKGAPFLITALMSFLKVPDFLNEIASSLVLISAIIAFFTLSSRSEITILRAGGFSLWHVIKPIGSTAFLLGIFWAFIFNPISIKMIKKSQELERKYIEQDTREYVAPATGVWIKQSNLENPKEEIIIQAKKVYKENIEFNSVKIWLFNENREFYKRIDAKKMFLNDGFWNLENAILNDENNLNTKIEKTTIPTTLQGDFIIEKVVNNFQNAKLFNIFEIPKLVQNLKSSGFSPVKFQVTFHSLLSKPILFLAMTLIACFFGLNHIRNNNSIFMIFLGISLGLIIYITSGIINTLGSSGLISVFASTWVISLIFLAVGILLIYHKEHS